VDRFGRNYRFSLLGNLRHRFSDSLNKMLILGPDRFSVSLPYHTLPTYAEVEF